jgi:hypothetical protein
LSPDDTKGSKLDPDTVAHKHRSFFFPDSGHGAANAAGFGWRSGGLSPCVFFVVLCYLLNPPLGGAKKYLLLNSSILIFLLTLYLARLRVLASRLAHVADFSLAT